MVHTFDYSALKEPLTKMDIDAYKRSGIQKIDRASKALKIITVSAVSLFVLAVMAVGFIAGMEHSLGIFFVLVPFGIIVVLLDWESRRTIRRRAKLFKFAVNNGLRFDAFIQNPAYPGMVFDNGDSRRINEVLRFEDGTEIGNYTYETGNGKNRRSHNWGYVQLPLIRHLPHMILDAKANNFWKFSNLSKAFDKSQTLSLEGNFDNYFTLYAPKQYERDALYVFTPDVMAAMIDHGKDYDIEIVDDKLFIYANRHFQLDTPAFYEHILAITNTIRGELVSQTDYYADERTGDRAIDVVMPGGRRLKQNLNWFAVVVIVITFILMAINIIQPLFR